MAEVFADSKDAHARFQQGAVQGDRRYATELVAQLPPDQFAAACWAFAENLRMAAAQLSPTGCNFQASTFNYGKRRDPDAQVNVTVNVPPPEVTVLPTEPKTRTSSATPRARS